MTPTILHRTIAIVAILTHAAFAEPAQWIGPSASHVNQWTRYRKTLHLESLPNQLETTVATDSKYWLWINGELVIREGGLKRGPNPHDTYADRIDLAPYLRKGENTIAVLNWYFGQNGFSHNSSGKCALYFDSGSPVLFSDSSWKLSPHPAIGTSADTRPNRRLPESSLSYDARLDEPAWTSPDFDDSGWSTPELFGPPPSQPWGQLVERPIPQWKDHGLKDYPETVAQEGVVIARLPYNAQVTPWLRVDAPAGLEIDIRTDNFMGGSDPNVHAKYITREGVQEFECLGWMNGHEVRYSIPEGIEVLALKYRETGYDSEFTGSFGCDDPDLDTLWKKAARTLYVTMRDTYMDCPDRERSQWWGDVVNELGEVPYVFDPESVLLTRKAIHELVDWQREDGTLYSPVPAGIPEGRQRKHMGGSDWFTELPVQMLASVGEYGFWEYYIQSGDVATIRHAYPAVRRYLELWELDGDGVAIHRPGDWDWSDWGQNIDTRILDSAWLRLAYEGAIRMAGLTGHDSDIPKWMELAGRLDESFNKVFWNGREYRSPGYRGDTDDRANALALLAGFAGPDKHPALVEVLENHRNASPWMEKYVLEALYVMNAPEIAVRRMKERYRPQIDSHLSTLWEGWGIGRKGFGGGSYNHAWSGGPLTCLSRFAAGIRPTEPAWRAYAIRPQMGPLRRIEARVDSPVGMIGVALKHEDGFLTAEVTGPDGADGELVLSPPLNEASEFELNGTTVQPDRSTATTLFFRIPPGSSAFRVKLPAE